MEPTPTFLEDLYRHQEQHSAPVVDEAFLQAFMALDEEGQIKAIAHIEGIMISTENTVWGRVQNARLSELYKAWFEYQTKDFVYEHYSSVLDEQDWQLSLESRRVEQEREEKEVLKDTETVSLDEARKALQL